MKKTVFFGAFLIISSAFGADLQPVELKLQEEIALPSENEQKNLSPEEKEIYQKLDLLSTEQSAKENFVADK